MSITKTIGGDRLGSGRKMKAHLNNYYRSTHNLSEKFASSMGSGILYPAMCKLAMRGDSFDIAINADARTIPTQGPLFGSYKMQVDVFQCPIRLYQSILHNNPTAIGLNMSKVMFPTIQIMTTGDKPEHFKFSDSCLLKYLGMSGLGQPAMRHGQFERGAYSRTINAIPALAYYDIFKNYYSNKQEEVGYVISPQEGNPQQALIEINIKYTGSTTRERFYPYTGQFFNVGNITYLSMVVNATNTTAANALENIYIGRIREQAQLIGQVLGTPTINEIRNYLGHVREYLFEWNLAQAPALSGNVRIFSEVYTGEFMSGISLTEFELDNIDQMRYEILSHTQFGESFKINENRAGQQLPYVTLFDRIFYSIPSESDEDDYEIQLTKNYFAENGLVIKTYQNDIFNNWLNTDWIEGENGISELSKVAVTNGEFSIDALSFATKLYNMLNRVVLSGNTYEDWQDVVYEEVKRKQVESPIYCGGMSQEIYFDEIVQTAPADGDPLGTLGGRGRLSGNKKGGKLHIKCDEACFIIAIVSLTPRIYYTQGNEFYLTDIMSMDDLHKPAMDGIGFQDLIGERMAWFDTILGDTSNDGEEVLHRSKIGKVPAWIEYMTSVDKAYGDFASTDGRGYMILNRNYEQNEDNGKLENGIKDATTYIDPAKYNYAFAYTELEAQNFWVQINFDIKARRLMSARLIPHV